MLSSSLGTIVRETTNFLVDERILSSTTSNITFSNLDGLADGGYRLELSVAGAVPTVYLYVNGDATNSNYYSTVIYTPYSGNGNANTWNHTGPVILAPESTLLGSAFVDVSIVGNRAYFFFQELRQLSTWLKHISGSGCYLPSIANITSLTLSGSTFPAGTVARLYRKRQGLPSAFPSPQGLLVADIVVPSSTTQVDISGLDGNLHGGYTIKASFMPFPDSNWSNMKLCVNGDTTDANYKITHTYSDGTAVKSSNKANSVFVTIYGTGITSSASKSSLVDIDATTFNGYFIAKLDAVRSLGTNPPTRTMGSILKETGSVMNITSLSIIADVTNGIVAGTRIQVYRRK